MVAHKLMKFKLMTHLLCGGVIMLTSCRYHSHISFTDEYICRQLLDRLYPATVIPINKVYLYRTTLLSGNH